MKGLHIHFEGFTASYPYPFLRSGTAITLPLPPFSSIFGMLSACAGRDIDPSEVGRVGYEFRSVGPYKGMDLERTDRLKTDPRGRLRLNPEKGIAKREFHISPKLDMYLTNVALQPIFENPVAVPRFGRSQDIAWITSITEIDFDVLKEGVIRATLAPSPSFMFGQPLPPLVDYYLNDVQQRTRVPGRISRYVAIPDVEALGREGFLVQSTEQIRLYHPSDSNYPEHAVILWNIQ
jgi:CRISPR-associated protein Cas5t